MSALTKDFDAAFPPRGLKALRSQLMHGHDAGASANAYTAFANARRPERLAASASIGDFLRALGASEKGE